MCCVCVTPIDVSKRDSMPNVIPYPCMWSPFCFFHHQHFPSVFASTKTNDQWCVRYCAVTAVSPIPMSRPTYTLKWHRTCNGHGTVRAHDPCHSFMYCQTLPINAKNISHGGKTKWCPHCISSSVSMISPYLNHTHVHNYIHCIPPFGSNWHNLCFASQATYSIYVPLLIFLIPCLLLREQRHM